ncbi:hypothetical protein Pla110_29820 [Polystyrenella longa]|uniref:Uncharacterized protein n=1 Tax=Polystyrenella longa TaxID=2528007 RepID=A0A518CPU5_9PLAN|nr:hypothetical protein [Polystyrenella longa]QDU81243.1 hypothetical protein Pla110_29820 [Polystyrenella longa]
MTTSSDSPAATPPDRSRIVFTQPDETTILFRLPGAGLRSLFLLELSLKWLGLIIFLCVTIAGIWQVWPFVIAMGVMLITGLCLLGYWFKKCFETVIIFLESERAVVRSNLFGWVRTKQLTLNVNSRADLVAIDEGPDYRVEVQGVEGVVSFGDSLIKSDQNWIVDKINEFLGAESDPAYSEQLALRSNILERATPTTVTVEEMQPNGLRIQLPTAATGGAKAGGMILGITLGMIPVFLGFEFNWWWPYYVVPASVCLLMAVWVIRGMNIVELTELQLRQTSLFGPCRVTSSVPTSEIIGIEVRLAVEREERVRINDVENTDHNCVATLSTPKKEFFIWMAKRQDATYVAELLQRKLSSLRNDV